MNAQHIRSAVPHFEPEQRVDQCAEGECWVGETTGPISRYDIANNRFHDTSGHERITVFVRYKEVRHCGLKVASNGVLIRPDPPEETTGSIAIPQTADRRNGQFEHIGTGEVLAIGDGHPITRGPDAGCKVPLLEKPGDRVLFLLKAGDEIELGGEKLRLIHENHVLGIVE